MDGANEARSAYSSVKYPYFHFTEPWPYQSISLWKWSLVSILGVHFMLAWKQASISRRSMILKKNHFSNLILKQVQEKNLFTRVFSNLTVCRLITHKKILPLIISTESSCHFYDNYVLTWNYFTWMLLNVLIFLVQMCIFCILMFVAWNIVSARRCW